MTYYPRNERSVGGVFTRMSFEIGYDSLFNVLKEFYPDLKRKFSHNHQRNSMRTDLGGDAYWRATARQSRIKPVYACLRNTSTSLSLDCGTIDVVSTLSVLPSSLSFIL
jgi:hypothetical protein